MNLINIFGLGVAIGALGIIYDVNFLKLNKLKFNTKKLQKESEIKILQISDFHNKKIFRNKTYENLLKKTSPDFIFITGDLINRKDEDFSGAIRLLKILKAYTNEIYFVRGNHECKSKYESQFIATLKELEINVLENEGVELRVRDVEFILYGVDDTRSNRDNLKKAFGVGSKSKLSIMISHSPQIVDKKFKKRVDLILLGDTHGGQIRLPFIGAIITSQGMFPKLQKGVYCVRKDGRLLSKHKVGKNEYNIVEDKCCKTVYIDSGVGVHSMPIRTFNRSQVTLININGTKDKDIQ